MKMMNGNAAIFYDMENLFKGYHDPKTYLENISLQTIIQNIQQLEIIERIIIQRAYANWSDHRLSIIRKDIYDLAIDPIQTLVFSYQQHKNATDIQLSVDCIDFLHIRPNIEVFVIVSGDGGFSSLAKKLHEYGKYVVGCSYESSMSESFASICDYFIPIIEPTLSNSEVHVNNQSQSIPISIPTKLKITNPLALKMSQDVARIETNDITEIRDHSKKVIRWFENDRDSSKQLRSQGIALSVIKEGFKYAVKNFDFTKIGFAKFVQFMQYICDGTKTKVIISENNQTKIIFKEINLNGFEDLPCLDDNFLHSVDNYKSILATREPRIHIVEPRTFEQVILYVISLGEKKYILDDIAQEIKNNDVSLSLDSIMQVLRTFISIGIFEIDNTNKHLTEQILFLKKEYRNVDNLYGKIHESIRTKLIGFFDSEVHHDVLQQINDVIKPTLQCDSELFDKYLKKGKQLLALEEYKQAKIYFYKAIRLNCNHLELLKNYGMTLVALDDLETGVKLFDYSLKIQPNDLSLLIQYANSLLIKMPEQSWLYWQKASEIDPYNINVVLGCGDVLIRMKKFKQSLPYWEKAMELNENDTEIKQIYEDVLNSLHVN